MRFVSSSRAFTDERKEKNIQYLVWKKGFCKLLKNLGKKELTNGGRSGILSKLSETRRSCQRREQKRFQRSEKST